jgi:hypothetical protein
VDLFTSFTSASVIWPSAFLSTLIIKIKTKPMHVNGDFSSHCFAVRGLWGLYMSKKI